MKAIQLAAPSLDAFRPVDLPDPVPGRGEALVRLRAASLNYIDHSVVAGAYRSAVFPVVPVADGAGEVVALGPEVDGLAVGDRVAIHPKAAWPAGAASAARAAAMRGVNRRGALREFAAVPVDTLVKLAPHLSWTAGASLPIVATTAWNALECAAIGPGDTVAVLGTGGLSIAALQLAKARGARVIVTSSSPEKLERARALGADAGVDYRANPAWDVAVRELTDGRGAALVLETAGAETLARSLAAVAHGGVVFTVGFVSGTQAPLDLLRVVEKGVRMQGNNTGSADDFAAAMAAIAAHRIEPVVDRVFDLGELPVAYERLGAGGHFGKLGLNVDF